MRWSGRSWSPTWTTCESNGRSRVLLDHRPREPHQFLGQMGVRPDRRRQGLGTAVLHPVLDELDRTGVPACLETSAPGNVAFYGVLGFAVVAHLDDLPAQAPETWVMWRPPGGLCR
jgi:predicted N-acetyltransferase YhbS